MARFRYTFYFEAAKFGWTETWYRSLGNNPDEAVDFTVNYVNRRRLGLGYGAYLTDVRAVDIDLPRRSRKKKSIDPPAGVPGVQGLSTRNPAWDAQLVTVYDETNVYKRQWYIRGCRDDWWQIGSAGEDTFTDAFRAWMNGMRDFLKNNGYAFRAVRKLNKVDMKVVTAVALELPSRFILVTAPGHAIVAAGDVKIAGCEGLNMRYVNGVRKVEVVDGDTLRIRTPLPVPLTLLYTGGGRLYQRTYIYPVVWSYSWRGYRHRDTGRPFELMRGRSRVLKRS